MRKVSQVSRARNVNKQMRVPSPCLSFSLSACYIDIDDEDDDADEQLDESQRVYSRWCELPNVVLEEIFTYLTPRERYYASLVSDQPSSLARSLSLCLS